MKIIFLYTLLAFLSSPLFSQTKPLKKSTATIDSVFVEKISLAMCNCLKPYVDSMPIAFENFILDIIEVGEEKAQKNLTTIVKSMSTEEQNKFLEFASKLDSDDMETSLNGCAGKIDAEFIAKSINDKGLEEAYKKALMQYLKKSKECRLTYLILALSDKMGK